MSARVREFAARLGVAFPIVQAPMAGGPTTPALVAAVAEAGALGSIGAAMLGPKAIAEACAETRSLSARPFLVNLFVLPPASASPALPAADWRRGRGRVRPSDPARR